MDSNAQNELHSGEPRWLRVVRPATFRGTISAAFNLAWLIISSLGTHLLYIVALLIGAVVGLSQGLLKATVEVAKSPFSSPSKKTVGGDDENFSGGRAREHFETATLPVREVDDLRPHLFVEPYDGIVEEQRGTEMHTLDDLVGPVSVEVVPAMEHKVQGLAPEIQAPTSAVDERKSEKMEAPVEPNAVEQETSKDMQEGVVLTQHRAPVMVEKVASAVETAAPETLAETRHMVLPSSKPTVESEAPVAITSTAVPVIQEVPPFVEQETETISPLKTSQGKGHFTAADLEGNALITKSARRSDQPTPEKALPEKISSEGPDTPKVPSPRPLGAGPVKQPADDSASAGASGSSATSTAPADAAAETSAGQTTEPETEPALAALPNAKPNVVEKDILPAVVLEEGGEHKGTNLKKKKQRGFIRGPIHKALKEIRKAFH